MSRILLVEELRERERLTLLLLRAALTARGHDARIVPLRHLIREYTASKPDAIVSNAVTNLGGFVGNYLLLDRRTRIVNLHWEQVLNPHSFLRYKFAPIVAERLIDGRASWGPAFKRALVALNPTLDPSRVGVVGSIKHSEGQFLLQVPRTELAKMYGIELERYSALVLCPTSFGASAFSAAELRDRKAQNPFIEQYLEQHVRTKQEFLEGVRILASRHPEMLFVLRAHPTNQRSYYASYEDEDFPRNLRLSAAGTISVALALADLVVTSSSTTLMDAYVQDKPAINLRLENYPYKDLALLHQREDSFGHQVPFSALPELGLERYLGRPLRTSELDRTISDWVGDYSSRAPDALARFIDETLAREPVSKRIGLSVLGSLRVLRRAASSVSERVVAHRRFRPIGAATSQDFDYDRLFEMIAERPRGSHQARAEQIAV